MRTCLRSHLLFICVMLVTICEVTAQLRVLSPSSRVPLTPGTLAKIVWKSPGAGWTYDVTASWNNGVATVIAQDLTEPSFVWQVPALTNDSVSVSVVGHGERGMVYGPLMHGATTRYILQTAEDRYLCLGAGPVATLWSELLESSLRSVVFQGVKRDNGDPYESAVSANGRYVATIDTLGMIRFYDVEYESQFGVPLFRATIVKMYGMIQSISPTGKYFVFITRQYGESDSVGCYDIKSGEVIWKIPSVDVLDEVVMHPVLPWVVVRSHGTTGTNCSIVDQNTGKVISSLNNVKILGWVNSGRIAMIEQDTSYLFRDAVSGADLSLRFSMRGTVSAPVLTSDGKHAIVSWIRHTDVSSYQRVLRYDLFSGIATDSIEFEGDHLDKRNCADDGSAVVASDEKAYVYLKFGQAPVYRTWGAEGFGYVVFDSKLNLMRVARTNGSTTYDLASGASLFDRPLGGFLQTDQVVVIPTQNRHMMFSSIPVKSFYVCEHERPLEGYTRQLPKAIVATAQNAQYGSLACVFSDSTFALINTSDNSIEEVVKVPLSKVRMIDQPAEPRTYYLASDTILLSVNSLSKRIDTIVVMPNKRVLVGGTYVRERDEFAFLTYKKSSRLVYVSFVSKDGVITESDSVMTAGSDVVGAQALVKVVNGGRRLLVSWCNNGYCILDLTTKKVERIVNDRAYEWVTDSNDSLAAFYTDSALCVIDLRNLRVDTLRRYARNQYLRSAVFSQGGTMLTVYDTKSLYILQYDWKSKAIVDSLPRSFGIALLTVANDDCTMYLHSEADAVITWSSCGKVNWEGEVRTIAQTSVSVDVRDESAVGREPNLITCVDGTLSIPAAWDGVTYMKIYSTIGQEVLSAHADHVDSERVHYNVRGLRPGLYIGAVNGRRSVLFSVLQ